MSTICPESRLRQRGFSIIAAIFILVVLGALAGFIVSLTTTQNVTIAQDFQGARAHQAARTGLEWGISRWLNSNTCSGASAYTGAVPNCSPGGAAATCTQQTVFTAATPPPAGFENFTLLVALCTCPAPPSGKTCQMTATASSGTLGSTGYIERQLQAVVEGN